MAVNMQTSTFSITLPMSCQICLGKVRQPVICPNCHVFCSSCMDTWMQNGSQCPTCRIPITTDNPCRQLIAGSSDGEDAQNRETSRRLRKTRGVLLLREYEDEIDRLLQENEELKTKVQSLGEVLPPAPTTQEPAGSTGDLAAAASTPDQRGSDLGELQQLSYKLKSATDVCSKVKEDMERLKQTNKMLRSQNVDLVQENMNLRAEVSNRSPQKFSRYTVAALEATIQQNEWKMKQLTKALEQSDKTIERLQARLQGYEGSPPSPWGAPGDPTEKQKLVMMRRSLSDRERQSICSNPEGQTLTSEGSNFLASPKTSEGEKMMGFTANTFYGTPPKLKPSTPSSAFCSLSLNSPTVGGGKTAMKAGTSLRKLSFEDLPEMVTSMVSQMENRSPNLPKHLAASTKAETSKSPFWGAWPEVKSNAPPNIGPISEDSQMVGDASSAATQVKPAGSHTSSEASMDAAYRNKVSELDCMMWDSDSSCSQGSRISQVASPAADLYATLVPVPKSVATPVESSSASKEEHDSVLSCQRTQPPCLGVLDVLRKAGSAGERAAGRADDIVQGGLESGRGDVLWSAKAGGVQDGDNSLVSGRAGDLGSERVGILQGIAAGLGCSWPGGVPVPSVVEGEGLSQTDQLSFDILFDSSLNGSAAGASGSGEPAILPQDDPTPSGWDNQLLSVGQPTKRSHSPFNTNSPTKLSKV